MKNLNKKYLLILFIITLIFSINFAYASVYIPPYSSPIKIDGKTYTRYALVSNTKSGTNVYSNLQDAVDSGYTTIIVDEGTIYSDNTTIVTQNNLMIMGISKDVSKLVMKNPTKDLLRIYANNVQIKNLTLDTKTYDAQAAFVIGDGNLDETNNETKAGNNVMLSQSSILGSDNIFALYVAGPTYRSTIYTKYSTNKLNSGNIIQDNYIEGTYYGGAFVFGLQKNGLVQNNTFSGGELNLYMDVNSTINDNKISNSNLSGLFISGPCYLLNIQNNTISSSKEHGIKSFYSNEDIPVTENLKYIQKSNIISNTISDSGETGIDLNYFQNGVVQKNTISNSSVHGISIINKSSSNYIGNNIINNFGLAQRFKGSGMFLAASSINNTLTYNTITASSIINLNTFDPVTGVSIQSDKQATISNIEYAGIFIETPDSTGNQFYNNSASGSFEYAGFYSYTKDVIFSNSNKITNTTGVDILYK